MEVKKFLIAGGNLTALVYDCPEKERGKTAKNLLKEVEQVGFISESSKIQMAGNELCINAILAFASTLQKEGKLTTSGIKNSIHYFNKQNLTTIQIPLKFIKKENVVLFEGIGYALFNKNEKSKVDKQEVLELAKKYNLPAFGVIIYEKDRITPYVYVKAVDSFVKETACGSGSVAFSLFSGINNVVQPTGKTISVKRNKFLEITAEVSLSN